VNYYSKGEFMDFSMTKPAFGSYMGTFTILILVTSVFALIVLMVVTSTRSTLSLENGMLTIDSLIYKTKLPLSSIDKENVKAINMYDEKLSITLRTNGIGLPHAQIGWFRGSGGKYKLYLTDKTSVVSIPTTEGYTILFSSKDAEQIVKIIKE
ncbi:MAG TPA: PH domain-containing protein, partial [Treponemataceae bacterium]|nr:PH domain-containing protein [Treponemataceae bacterium]